MLSKPWKWEKKLVSLHVYFIHAKHLKVLENYTCSCQINNISKNNTSGFALNTCRRKPPGIACDVFMLIRENILFVYNWVALKFDELMFLHTEQLYLRYMGIIDFSATIHIKQQLTSKEILCRHHNRNCLFGPIHTEGCKAFATVCFDICHHFIWIAA